MKSVKRFARMTALAVAVCMLLTLSVFAAESGTVWVTASSAEGETVAEVMADCVVTDGVVEMTYDADALTYRDLQVNETYVAMYSVNAEEDGVVKIAWVAPGEVEIDGEDWLFKLCATGETDEEPTLDGTVTGAEIGEAPEEGEEPTEPEEDEDPTEPEDGEDVTEPEAGEDATDPEEDETVPEVGEDGDESEEDEEPTKPEGNKKPGSNRPGRPGTGDNSSITMLVIVALACVAGIAAVAFVMRKGKKEGKA